jgi:hypothetical protein
MEIKNILPNWSWFYILYVFIVFFAGCAGPAEEKQEITETETVKMPPPRQNKLAPGTVKVEARMIKMNKENSHYNCIIKLEKVLGYGMSTKPIGKGTEIYLQISNNENDLINLLLEGTSEEKYEFTVVQEQMVDNQLRYRVVKVKKILSDH